MANLQRLQGSAHALPSYHVNIGDCVHVMGQMPDQSVGLIVTDPPYLVNYRDRHGRSIANDVSDHWLAPAFEQAYRLLKNDSFCISFYGFHVVDKFMASWRSAGFKPVGQFIWHKSYASSQSFTEYRHEAAYLLAKGNPQTPVKPLPSVMPWTYTGNKLHPTQKAANVLKPLIETYSKPNDVVLDPFCGSGSTLVAACQTGREAIGVELNRAHALTAKRRLNALIGGW